MVILYNIACVVDEAWFSFVFVTLVGVERGSGLVSIDFFLFFFCCVINQACDDGGLVYRAAGWLALLLLCVEVATGQSLYMNQHLLSLFHVFMGA